MHHPASLLILSSPSALQLLHVPTLDVYVIYAHTAPCCSPPPRFAADCCSYLKYRPEGTADTGELLRHTCTKSPFTIITTAIEEAVAKARKDYKGAVVELFVTGEGVAGVMHSQGAWFRPAEAVAMLGCITRRMAIQGEGYLRLLPFVFDHSCLGCLSNSAVSWWGSASGPNLCSSASGLLCFRKCIRHGV